MRSWERVALGGMAMIVALVFIMVNPMMPIHRFYVGDFPDAGTLPAKSAKEFTEGVCVNAHWYFGSTPYTNNYTDMKTALQDLHITCVRDQWYPGSTTQKDRFVDLAAVGIKHSVIMDSRIFDADAAARAAADADSSGAVSVAEAIDHLLDNAPGSVLTLEGPNENIFDGTSCTSTISQANQIWAVKQADSRLTDIPVLSPSASDPNHYTCLGDLSAVTDEGNIHSYPGGVTPEATEHGPPWSLQGWMDNATVPVGSGSPMTATETGYHNATSTSSGHIPASETADGKYMSQMFFSYQRLGVHRIYKYELVNQTNEPTLTDIEKHFGLLRNDLTQKPSYVSINRIMDLLSDPTPAYLTRLNHTVTSTPANFKSYLIQKSDGSHWLAMWNDISVWDTVTKTDLTPSDVTVTVTFDSSKSLTVYRPYVSASPVTTTTASSVNVAINADVVLVRVA